MNLVKILSQTTLFLLASLLTTFALLLITTLVSIPAYSQDIEKQNKENIRKFIFENDRVRVSEIRLQPGQKSELLTFDLPGYMYIAKPSKLHFRWKNKTQDLIVDDSGTILSITAHHWTESEPPHTVVNVGDKEFLAIRFEIKPSQ